MGKIVTILELIIFFQFFLSIVYLLFFAIVSQKKHELYHRPTKKQHRILVLFPAYKEDRVIIDSVCSFLNQDYPTDLYTVAVISDRMKNETDEQLRQHSVIVLNANYTNSTKAAALNLAINHFGSGSFDIVAILDADNHTQPDFMTKINDVYDSGIRAIQAHRTTKGGDAGVAILDSVSEEINNAIFREGHVRLGLSSALIGSGMAFDYDWFARSISKVSTAGEDKELELLLLKEGVFIDYLSDLYVYDQKTSTSVGYYHQRRRWIAAQFDLFKRGLPYLPKAISTGNIDYCDKIFQWLIPPRMLLISIPFLFGSILLFLDWTRSIKWWVALFMLIMAFSLAMPDELYTKSFKKALRKLPLLCLLTVINLFRLRGVNKKFIHKKEEEKKDENSD
jgi:cellulose synthase/poly-beta-1,6-N-acetylglucosamine synthase-like glycosyltransferase